MEYNLLEDSVKTSLVDKNFISSFSYQHRLISNSDEKIVSTIREELKNCDEFIISVAFITQGGVTMILEELKNLANRGVRGKILTGDYLSFTQPKALKKLMEFENIEIRLLEDEKFHAKGYFFRKDKMWNVIIGSSNLTQTAFSVNFEWNIKLTSKDSGKLVEDVLTNFNSAFLRGKTLDEKALLDYEKRYEKMRETLLENRQKVREDKMREDKIREDKKISPNFMQEKALESLDILRKTKRRALLISATGTGKTYLSAFEVKNSGYKKILFIAHRKTILYKSMSTYKNILKGQKMAVYGEEDIDNCDIVFAMVQTLGKEEHLKKFEKDYFDYIIIDEVHHSGANTYQRIINYFDPKFMLGMTATPERGDGFDIYKTFDNNIAYEIRLYEALSENLLCPFHYFGISDIVIDGELISDKSDIKKLTATKRVEHILEKSKFYGYSGKSIHALIFVSRVEEALILKEKMREKGVRCEALVGSDSDEFREKTIERFENSEIDYIISVDIFNEGVDIPIVNQVILLRPTTSSIVYIQQLGRGLRKHPDKEYVVVLDFIGNYEKNFLIPIAISQNSNYDKDFMKSFLLSGTDIIPGESTITFEEIVAQKIFDNINKSNFSTRKNIQKDFDYLEKQLGRIPLLFDFFEKNMIEPSIILKYKKNYDEVLKVLRPHLELGCLNVFEKNYLDFLSIFFTPAKRVHEMLLLKELIHKKSMSLENLYHIFEEKYGIKDENANIENAILHLEKRIFTSLSTIKPYLPIIISSDKEIKLCEDFEKSYFTNSYFKLLVDDLIRYNLGYANKNYNRISKKSILKYKEYSKLEAFWYLNLDFNNGYQVSGYTVFEDVKKVVIFITLDEEKLADYDNSFSNAQTFSWFSKSKRVLKRGDTLTIEGKIAQNYYEIEVFIKKKLGENFYYLGCVDSVLDAFETSDKLGNSLVEYKLKLKEEIDKNLFNYLFSKN